MKSEPLQETDFYDAATVVEVHEKKASMIYNVLPAVVQSRIPTLPSIRGAISGVRTRSIHAGHAPLNDSDISLPLSPAPAPTPKAQSPETSTHSSARNSYISTDDDYSFQESISEPPASSVSTPPQISMWETQTGINWKYANQGVSLTTQAYSESHSSRTDETTTILTRQLYVHGLTYLLRGLPTELNPEETLSLQAALPQSLVVVQTEPCSHDLVPFDPEASGHQAPPSEPSVLHRATAVVVFETLVMIQFLVPYIKLFFGHAYRFERKHNITQRLVNNGLMTADAVRKASLQLTQTVCQMNDGKVGQALNDITLWWVRGLTGGLQQGIQEGFKLMGNEIPQGTRRRSRSE